MPPALTDGQKVLIQALLSRGPLPEEEFLSIFGGVTGKNPENHQRLFNDYLLKINRELSYLNCEVRCCKNQYDGMVYYGFVNNIADEESKLGTKYSVPQIAFYRAIIEAIVQDAAAQGSISNIEALNLQLEHQVHAEGGSQSQDHPSTTPAAFRNFTMTQKEKTLAEFLRDRWLSASDDGRIGLGIRSFFDLRSWFRSNDIPSCEVCNEAAVKAEFCPNESCTARVHEYCLKQRFSQRRADRTCPSCGYQWGFSGPKAEQVEEEDEQKPIQSQPPVAAGKRRLRTGGARRSVTAQSQPVPDVSGQRRTTRSSSHHQS